MNKTVFSYIVIIYISCVNASFKFRHLEYATGFEDPQRLRYLRHLEYATGFDDSNY